MSKELSNFLETSFPSEYPDLLIDIDSIPNLDVFKKIRSQLEKPGVINQIIGFFLQDLHNPTEMPKILNFLKSLLIILGLQLTFPICKSTILKTLQLSCITAQNKSVFADIMAIIFEKINVLLKSGFEFDETKNLETIKLPQNIVSKLSKYAKNSQFEEIYLEGLILQRKIGDFLRGNKRNNTATEFLKELDKFQSRLIQSLNMKISKLENNMLREMTGFNKILVDELENGLNISGDMMKIGGKSIKKENLLANRVSFKRGESLPLEDMEIEYKNYYFPFALDQITKLSNCVSAFLNTNGGRIFLGVKDEGNVVVGMRLTDKKKSDLVDHLLSIFESFEPKLSPKQYRVLFLPIINDFDQVFNGLYVVKLIIKRGERLLYSTNERKYYKRRDGKVKLLSPEEMKLELEKKIKNMVPNENFDEFNDPEPEKQNSGSYNSSTSLNPNNPNHKGNFNSHNNHYNDRLEQKYAKVYFKKEKKEEIIEKFEEETKQEPIILKKSVSKDLNQKVILIRILDQIDDKKTMCELFMKIKNIINIVYPEKIEKIIERFEKRIGFFEFKDDEIYKKKVEVFSMINDNLNDPECKNKWSIQLDFAEKLMFEKYEKKMIRIK